MKDINITLDPVLSSEVVLDFVQRHMPGAREVKQVDETGNRARTYLVDDHLVLKTQRPSKIRPQTSLEKEVFFLNQIRTQDEQISVPRVLGYGKDGDIEYTVMTRMPGKAWRWLNLEGEERHRVLYELGRTLRQIHSLDQTPFRESPLFQGDLCVTNVKDAIQQSFATVIERLGDRPTGWTLAITTDQVAKKVLDTFPANVGTVAIHTNPGPPHTFVDVTNNTFSGVIDFGDAYINHPAYDFMPWRSVADQKSVLDGYTAEASVSDEFMAVWRSVVILQMLRMSIRNGTVPPSEDLQIWLSQL